MTSTGPAPTTVRGLGSAPTTAAQSRVVTAALGLFAEHGVGGTSLAMIADALGVTKAAVYHQYRTKDEIVIAATAAELGRMELVIEAAEAEEDRQAALGVLLVRLIDVAVDNRRMVSMVHRDPVMVRLLEEHEPFRDVMDRLHRILVGDDPTADTRVPAAIVTAALASAASSPLVEDLDDDTLRASLLDLASRFLDIPT